MHFQTSPWKIIPQPFLEWVKKPKTQNITTNLSSANYTNTHAATLHTAVPGAGFAHLQMHVVSPTKVSELSAASAISLLILKYLQELSKSKQTKPKTTHKQTKKTNKLEHHVNATLFSYL